MFCCACREYKVLFEVMAWNEIASFYTIREMDNVLSTPVVAALLEPEIRWEVRLNQELWTSLSGTGTRAEDVGQMTFIPKYIFVNSTNARSEIPISTLTTTADIGVGGDNLQYQRFSTPRSRAGTYEVQVWVLDPGSEQFAEVGQAVHQVSGKLIPVQLFYYYCQWCSIVK